MDRRLSFNLHYSHILATLARTLGEAAAVYVQRATDPTFGRATREYYQNAAHENACDAAHHANISIRLRAEAGQ